MEGSVIVTGDQMTALTRFCRGYNVRFLMLENDGEPEDEIPGYLRVGATIKPNIHRSFVLDMNGKPVRLERA